MILSPLGGKRLQQWLHFLPNVFEHGSGLGFGHPTPDHNAVYFVRTRGWLRHAVQGTNLFTDYSVWHCCGKGKGSESKDELNYLVGWQITWCMVDNLIYISTVCYPKDGFKMSWTMDVWMTCILYAWSHGYIYVSSICCMYFADTAVCMFVCVVRDTKYLSKESRREWRSQTEEFRRTRRQIWWRRDGDLRPRGLSISQAARRRRVARRTLPVWRGAWQSDITSQTLLTTQSVLIH